MKHDCFGSLAVGRRHSHSFRISLFFLVLVAPFLCLLPSLLLQFLLSSSLLIPPSPHSPLSPHSPGAGAVSFGLSCRQDHCSLVQALYPCKHILAHEPACQSLAWQPFHCGWKAYPFTTFRVIPMESRGCPSSFKRQKPPRSKVGPPCTPPFHRQCHVASFRHMKAPHPRLLHPAPRLAIFSASRDSLRHVHRISESSTRTS